MNITNLGPVVPLLFATTTSRLPQGYLAWWWHGGTRGPGPLQLVRNSCRASVLLLITVGFAHCLDATTP